MAGYISLWEGYHNQTHQKCWGISVPKYLHPFHWECLLCLDLFFLEYWAFVQNWRSIHVNLLDKSEFTCRKTGNSDWSFKTASENLQISSTTWLLASSSLLCRNSTILFMSVLFIFSNGLHMLPYSSQVVTKLKIPVAKLKLKYYSTTNHVRMLLCSTAILSINIE